VPLSSPGFEIVHCRFTGALGHSNDTPLAQMLIGARCSRIADGADEVHLMRIAEMVMRSYNETGSVNSAVGGLPL
jgi:acyl-CoA dehydrogenase